MIYKSIGRIIKNQTKVEKGKCQDYYYVNQSLHFGQQTHEFAEKAIEQNKNWIEFVQNFPKLVHFT
jgi:hypothetical protein